MSVLLLVNLFPYLLFFTMYDLCHFLNVSSHKKINKRTYTKC